MAAAAILLGSLLGCAYTATRATTSDEPSAAPLISATTPARDIAPLAIPPRENYGAPYVESRIHPVAVAAAMTLFSVLGLTVFSATRVPKTSKQTLAARREIG